MSIGSGGINEVWLPSGGVNGYVLAKTADDNYAIDWVPNAGGGGTGADGFNRLSAGTQLAGTFQTVKFADSNGIVWGMSGNSQITASYTVPNIAGLLSAINVSAGSTSNNLSALTFANSNGVSFGLNASTITLSVKTDYLTAQTNPAFSAQGGSTSFQTLGFSNANGFTFSNSNGSVVGSYTVPSTTGLVSAINLSAGTTSTNASAFTFSNLNGLSFGLNGQTITGSYTVPTQTNQSVGLFGLGNTTQNSSATLDARSLSFNGLGALTVGFSNGSIQLSAPTQTTQSAIRGFGASNTGNTAGNTGLSTGVDWVLAGSNNITISQSTAVGGPNTLWVSGGNGGGAQTGISGIQVSDTTYTSGTVTFRNANGITFGSSGAGGISASYTVPSTAGLISAINLSAGTTSNNLSAMTFSNLNGVTFGLNGSVVTASVAAVGGAQTGISGIANSETTYTSGSVTFSALGAITIRSTTGQQFQFSVNAQSVVPGIQTIAFANTTFTTGGLTFSNANGFSFGSSGGQVTASYTVPTQTVQTEGMYALGNTTGQSSSSTFDARTMSINGAGAVSVGYSNSSLIISAPNTIAQTNQTVGLYALGNTTQNSSTTMDARTLSFNALGAATMGYSNGSIQVSVPVQTNQTIGIYGTSNTTVNSSGTIDARSLTVRAYGILSIGTSNGSVLLSTPDPVNFTQLSVGNSTGGNTAGDTGVFTGQVVFVGSNNITLSGSSNAGSVTLSIIGGAGGGGAGISAGTQSVSTGTVVFSNSNNVTFGMSGSSRITASYAFNVSAGTTSNNLSAITFSNSNNMTFGLNASTITASYTAPNTLSVFAQSNTTQSSSGTMPYSSLQFAGAGIASVGVTNGSVVISVPSGGGGVTPVASASNGSFSFTTLAFSNANNVTFGTSAGSIITASVAAPGAAAENNWFNLLGANTAGNTTASGSTIGLSGINLTLSGTNASAINISAPATSSLVGVNGISLSTNGSTISVFQNSQSFYEVKARGASTTNSLANGTVYFQPFFVDEPVAAYHLRYFQNVSSQSVTTMSISGSVSAGNASSGTGQFGATGTMMFFSRQSTGTVANSSNIISFASASYSYRIGYSNSVSWSTNASSATVSWTTSAALSFISNIDSTGGITTGSTGFSGSSTFSSTSTNANSFSSSYIMSAATGSLVGSVRPVFVPITANLAPGEYWLGHIMSTTTGSTNYALNRIVSLSNSGVLAFTSNTQGYLEFGQVATTANSNFIPGWGSYSASSQTSTTIPLSQISNMSQFQTYFALFGATK